MRSTAGLASTQRAFLRMRHEASLALLAAIRRRLAAPGMASAPPNPADLAAAAGATQAPAPPPLALPCSRTSFGPEDLALLAGGDLARVFGAAHATHGMNGRLRLQGGRLSRVVSVQPASGAHGLGRVVAEQDSSLDASPVDACAELLRFYLLYAGAHIFSREGAFEAVAGLPRTQPQTAEGPVTYCLDVAELTFSPKPRVTANVEIIAAGHTQALWRGLSLGIGDALSGSTTLPDLPVRKPALFNERHIHELTVGSIAACCGPAFATYDGRRGPRLPNGDLQLVSRVVDAQGTWGAFDRPASVVAELDVPPDAWFCTETGSPELPFSILMELGLQPCGFVSFWLGSTFISPERDYRFRNLSGRGELLRRVDVRGKTVQARAGLLSTVSMSGMIVQKFGIELRCDGRPFYSGEAGCGYFDTQALLAHTGLDGGGKAPPWMAAYAGCGTELDRGDLLAGRPGAPSLRLAGRHFDLLDRITVIEGGGRFETGYIYAERRVNPFDWFYANHFYQDPVMPGSLGVQAMVEALKAYAIAVGLGSDLRSPRFGHPPRQATTWKYRGQILPTHESMTLELHVKSIERTRDGVVLLADGSLWGNELRIYEVTGLGLSLVEAQPA